MCSNQHPPWHHIEPKSRGICFPRLSTTVNNPYARSNVSYLQPRAPLSSPRLRPLLLITAKEQHHRIAIPKQRRDSSFLGLGETCNLSTSTSCLTVCACSKCPCMRGASFMIKDTGCSPFASFRTSFVPDWSSSDEGTKEGEACDVTTCSSR